MKNKIWANFPEPTEPEIGMGGTLCVGSDCYPVTVVDMNENKTEVVVQSDNYKPDVGYDYYGNQVYIYERNTSSPKLHFTLRKNGYWVQKKGTQLLSLGHRRAYQDPSF